MSKSLAETVNFAEAVQKKQYEKRAQQVDTFVRSETAEQKLARSGKMQTAKALEALASLGGTVFDAQAKQSEERVRQLQLELADITASEIQEDTQKNPVFKTEKFGELPLRFQTKVRRDVGFARALRQGAQVEANISKYTYLDKDALNTFLEENRDDVEVINGLDAHEAAGYNQGWAKIRERIQNTSNTKIAEHNDAKIEENFKTGVARIVAEGQEVFIKLKEADALDPKKEISLRKNIAIDVWADTEKHIKDFKTEAGITLDPYYAKKFTRESLIAAAKASKNPFLLENVPDQYQDAASLHFLQQARLELAAELKADKDKAKTAILQENSLAAIQAETDAVDGTLQAKQDAYSADPQNNPSLTFTETETLKKWNEQLSISSTKSSINADVFQDQVEFSIYAQRNSEKPVLKDLEGNDVLHNGKSIPLDKAGLSEYVNGVNGLFIEGDAKGLVLNMDANLVGIDTLRFYTAGGTESASSKANKLIEGNTDRAAGKNNETRRSAFQLEMQDLHREAYEQHYYDAKAANNWGVLNTQQKKQVAKKAQADLQDAIDKRLLNKDSGNNNVDLDGEPILGSETSNVQTYEELSPSFKNAWEEIKDDEALVERWKDEGLPIPKTEEEVEEEIRIVEEDLIERSNERTQRMNQILEREGVDTERLSDLMFNELHHKYGDGLRYLNFEKRKTLKELNLSKEERAFLEEQITHTIASDFINSAAEKASSTLDSDDWAKWQKYAKDVMEDPYNVYKYDDWLEGDETTGMKGTGLDKEVILKLAREYDWFDPQVMNNDKEYK